MNIHLASILTAAQLRETMAENEAERLRAELMAKTRAERALSDYTEHFLHDHLNRRDLAELRTRLIAAAARGAFDVMIMRFPSSLCTDEGRAINNGEPHWAETLRGKAHEAYMLWERVGKPNGFRMRAAIVDFPGGVPGDVGLFLDWSRPVAI